MQDLNGNDVTMMRFIESRPGSMTLGTSWRKLHSPTMFGWGRSLQSREVHWPQEVVHGMTMLNEAQLLQARHELLRSADVLEHEDLGAGSRVWGKRSTKRRRRVSDVAKQSLTPHVDLMAMCRWLCMLQGDRTFLELGTCLGLTSAAISRLGWQVETWEGCAQTLERAHEVWRELGVEQGIRSRRGDFRELLRSIDSETQWEVVYLDGLHEGEATVEMVRALMPHVAQCIVLDDIAWSKGMHSAWTFLRKQPEWRVTFSWRGRGFLLKAPHMARQHFRL